MYSEDPASGTILLSMATDSSCRNGLRSPEEGAETYLMRRVPDDDGHQRQREAPGCSFPQWAQGKWSGVEVTAGHVNLRDDVQYRTVSAACLKEDVSSRHRQGEMYHVHTRSHW
jgi:hypothetical protein